MTDQREYYYFHVGDYKDRNYVGYAYITAGLWAFLSQIGLIVMLLPWYRK